MNPSPQSSPRCGERKKVAHYCANGRMTIGRDPVSLSSIGWRRGPGRGGS
jgi:hypothetical protein